MPVLNGSYLLIVFVLPLALFAVVRYRALPMGRQCPQCGTDTIPLMHRWLRILSRVNPFTAFQRRWCPCCHWEATVRMSRRQTRAAAAPRERAQSTDTLDLRWLTVDGRPWRVMLHCWQHTGLFYGRYVFIGPSGRLWLDGLEAFSGSTRHEVLGQALSVPDGLLVDRVRQLVGDC